MFESAQAIWDDAYTLAASNPPADADDSSKDSQVLLQDDKKASVDKDNNQPPLLGNSNAANTPPTSMDLQNEAIDDYMNWHIGKYVWEFFHSFQPEELFKVKELLKDQAKNKKVKEDDEITVGNEAPEIEGDNDADDS